MPCVQCRTEFSYISTPSPTYGVDYGPLAPPNRQPHRKILDSCPEPAKTLWQKDIQPYEVPRSGWNHIAINFNFAK
jgi:hypothetical protein